MQPESGDKGTVEFTKPSVLILSGLRTDTEIIRLTSRVYQIFKRFLNTNSPQYEMYDGTFISRADNKQ